MAGDDQERGDWAVQLAEAAGEGAAVGDAFGVPVFDVPPGRWLDTLVAAQRAGLTFFDWLSAVDERDEGFTVVAHIANMSSTPLLHLLVRTRIARDDPSLPSATSVYRGAAWHERETHEMFGIAFDGHPNPAKLLLPEEFEGHPLRKDFVLAARAAKPWPGAKEPGEGGAASPSRRRMQPPGVPDPSWGPRPPAADPAEPGEGHAATDEASARPNQNVNAAQAEGTTGGEGAANEKSAAEKAAPEKAAPDRSDAEKTRAKKTATKKTPAKTTTTKKAAAKKTTTKKAATKKAAAKKTTTKKAASKKATPVKKSPGETSPGKKSPGKKATDETTDGAADSPRDDGESGGDAT